jgi:hypothetical protein
MTLPEESRDVIGKSQEIWSWLVIYEGHLHTYLESEFTTSEKSNSIVGPYKNISPKD